MLAAASELSEQLIQLLGGLDVASLSQDSPIFGLSGAVMNALAKSKVHLPTVIADPLSLVPQPCGVYPTPLPEFDPADQTWLPLALAHRPDQFEALRQTRAWQLLDEAMRRVGSRLHGRLRPSGHLAAVLEKELLTAINELIDEKPKFRHFSKLDTGAQSGTDIPVGCVDVKTTDSKQRDLAKHVAQPRLRIMCGCDRVLGTGEHLVMFYYSVNPDKILNIHTCFIVPRWQTADKKLAEKAELLRQNVVAGHMTVHDAVRELQAKKDVLSGNVCSRLYAVLESPDPIPFADMAVIGSFLARQDNAAQVPALPSDDPRTIATSEDFDRMQQRAAQREQATLHKRHANTTNDRAVSTYLHTLAEHVAGGDDEWFAAEVGQESFVFDDAIEVDADIESYFDLE